MTIVFDLFLIGIIGFCGWQGYKRGLLASIMALVFILVSIYGGNLIARAYSSEFTSVLNPFVGGYMDRVLSDAVAHTVPEEDQVLSLEDLIRLDGSLADTISKQAYLELGVHEKSAARLAVQTIELRERNELTVQSALIQVICETVCFLLVFVIAGLLILIAFTVVANIIHLSFKIPGYRLVDDIGGGTLGALQGLCFCFLIAWLTGFMGKLIPTEITQDTIVLKLLMNANPVSTYLGL